MAGDQLDDPVVVDLGEAQPPIFLRNLDSEEPQRLQAVHDLRGYVPFPIDAVGIDLLHEKGFHLIQDLVPCLFVLRVLLWKGKDKVAAQAPHEQILDEARFFPFLFPCLLGHLQGAFFLGVLSAHSAPLLKKVIHHC